MIEELVKSKSIPQEALSKLFQQQKEHNLPLRKLLLQEGLVSENELLSILSHHLYIPTLRLDKYKFDPAVTSLLPEETCRRWGIIPLARIADALTVAMADPLNVFLIDDLKALTGYRIDIVLSPEDEIRKALDSVYHRQDSESIQEVIDEISEDSFSEEESEYPEQEDEEILLGDALQESESPPIVKLVELILIQALKKRSSDIHLEPEESCLRVRYRIDGNLYDIFRLPKKNQNAILARLKIISNMNITESRLPQDGRFKVRLEKSEIDFRVSALPTGFGQKFVLRALDKSNLAIGLDKLGFSEDPLRLFNEAIARPFGMILVTGPTGSGKSTTLYSILNKLNAPERNIITVEDPVEYQLEGITQIPVRHEIGLNFAAGLRALLRQSPDIIMVGEIRDAETADIAVKAALTGQLLFSTLHTNDAASSITRLMDMGVEAFLISSSLIMACAQRLCRRLCKSCRLIYHPPPRILAELGITDGEIREINFYQAKGCSACNYTGFFGRVAILEALLIDDYIRQLIVKKGSLEEIKRYAIEKKGMRTLRDDAILKAKQGLTTLDEAIRITSEEQ